MPMGLRIGLIAVAIIVIFLLVLIEMSWRIEGVGGQAKHASQLTPQTHSRSVSVSEAGAQHVTSKFLADRLPRGALGFVAAIPVWASIVVPIGLAVIICVSSIRFHWWDDVDTSATCGLVIVAGTLISILWVALKPLFVFMALYYGAGNDFERTCCAIPRPYIWTGMVIAALWTVVLFFVIVIASGDEYSRTTRRWKRGAYVALGINLAYFVFCAVMDYQHEKISKPVSKIDTITTLMILEARCSADGGLFGKIPGAYPEALSLT